MCRYNLKINVVNVTFVLLLCILNSCALQKRIIDNRNSQGPVQNVEDATTPPTQSNQQSGSLTADEDGYTSDLYFPVFDPKYNFVRDGKTKASGLAEKFPVFDNTQISILEDGNDYLRARLDLIDSAKQKIDIQTLILQSDEAGVMFVDRLIAAHRRGIQIRILIDPVSNLELKRQSLLSKLKSSGIFVEGWEPLYLYALSMYKPTTTLQDFLDEGNQRMHEKAFIVDAGTSNATAIVGGSNIGNNYFRLIGKNPIDVWSDKDVSIKGEMVNLISKEFQKNLDTVANFKKSEAILNLDPIWKLINFAKNILKKEPESIIQKFDLDPNLKKQFEDVDGKPHTDIWHNTKARYLLSRPRNDETYIYHAYHNFIQNSRSEILILNSYFLPTESFRKSFEDAIKRGVKIKIITNSAEVNDNPAVSLAARTLYLDLLSRNKQAANGGMLEIFEWGGDPLLKNGEGLNHSKYAVFDRRAAIVGSYNLDPRSANLNSENVVCFENNEAAKILAEQFDVAVGKKYTIAITESKAKTFSDPNDAMGKIKNKFLDSLIPML